LFENEEKPEMVPEPCNEKRELAMLMKT